MEDKHNDEINQEALKKAFPAWKKKHEIKDEKKVNDFLHIDDPIVMEMFEKWEGKSLKEVREETQKRIKEIYGLDIKLNRWTKILNKFRKKNLSYIHICLICGQFNPININKFKEDTEDSSGVFYGCMRCDYSFSIDKTDDGSHPCPVENITGWKLKEAEQYKRLYLLDRPDEVQMLAYQQSVTKMMIGSVKSFNDEYDELSDMKKKQLGKDKEDEDILDHIYDSDRTEAASWTDAEILHNHKGKSVFKTLEEEKEEEE